jgi:uncharacterized membrane protein
VIDSVINVLFVRGWNSFAVVGGVIVRFVRGWNGFVVVRSWFVVGASFVVGDWFVRFVRGWNIRKVY